MSCSEGACGETEWLRRKKKARDVAGVASAKTRGRGLHLAVHGIQGCWEREMVELASTEVHPILLFYMGLRIFDRNLPPLLPRNLLP
jgi:hypothetical protein